MEGRKIIWLSVLLIAFAATVWTIALAGGFEWGEPRTLAFVTACVALAPFHTGLASGNPSILVIGLCAAAILAATRQHDVAAGILFGVACSLKPQIGAFLVLYYLVRRRWQLFATVASPARSVWLQWPRCICGCEAPPGFTIIFTMLADSSRPTTLTTSPPRIQAASR